jgi:hypothetical protein
MAYFGYPKHKLWTLKLEQQHFLIQSSFWIKIYLIQRLDDEDCIKTMYIGYITYDF